MGRLALAVRVPLEEGQSVRWARRRCGSGGSASRAENEEKKKKRRHAGALQKPLSSQPRVADQDTFARNRRRRGQSIRAIAVMVPRSPG